MVDFGLSDAGFVAPRSDDFLTIMRDEYERLTELTIDWDNELFLGQLTNAAAIAFGRPAESLQALADALDINNASGAFLSILGSRNGTILQGATQSVVTMQLDGDEGTIVPVGTEFRDDDGQTWVLDEDVTLDTLVSGTVYRGTGRTLAKVAGAATAAPGDIDEIRTPVGGLESVTNPAAAQVGRNRENDAAYVARYIQTIARGGKTSIAATRAALLDVKDVTAAVVLENDDPTEQTIEGIDMAPHSIACVVFPDLGTEDYKTAIALAIAENKAGAVKTSPLDSPDDSRVVEKGDEIQQTIRWSYATQIDFDVTISVTLATGTTTDDVEDQITTIVEDYFDTRSIGDDLFAVKIIGAIEQKIEALQDCEVDFGSGVSVNRETIDATEIANLNSVSVTEI